MNEFIKNLSLKSLAISFVLAFVGALVVRIILPVPVITFMVTVVFIIILNIMLGILEEDNPTKRFLKKAWIFVLGVSAFIGLRIAAVYLFDMPLADTYDALNNVGILGIPALQKIPEAFILELLFIVPAAGVAYGMVKGGKGTKGFLYCLSVALFFFVLWSIRQPEFSHNAKSYAQSKINVASSNLELGALENNSKAKMAIYVAIEDISNNIRCGTKVALVERKTSMAGQEEVIKVVLEVNGMFGGQEYTVPMRKLMKWEATKTPPQTQADYKVYGPGQKKEFILKAGEYSDHYIRADKGVYTSFLLGYGDFKMVTRSGKKYSIEEIPKYNQEDFRIYAVIDTDMGLVFS